MPAKETKKQAAARAARERLAKAVSKERKQSARESHPLLALAAEQAKGGFAKSVEGRGAQTEDSRPGASAANPELKAKPTGEKLESIQESTENLSTDNVPTVVLSTGSGGSSSSGPLSSEEPKKGASSKRDKKQGSSTSPDTKNGRFHEEKQSSNDSLPTEILSAAQLSTDKLSTEVLPTGNQPALSSAFAPASNSGSCVANKTLALGEDRPSPAEGLARSKKVSQNVDFQGSDLNSSSNEKHQQIQVPADYLSADALLTDNLSADAKPTYELSTDILPTENLQTDSLQAENLSAEDLSTEVLAAKISSTTYDAKPRSTGGKTVSRAATSAIKITWVVDLGRDANFVEDRIIDIVGSKAGTLGLVRFYRKLYEKAFAQNDPVIRCKRPELERLGGATGDTITRWLKKGVKMGLFAHVSLTLPREGYPAGTYIMLKFPWID